jgi:fermentation-respiration switch protein FrsA (DUF1100 family)
MAGTGLDGRQILVMQGQLILKALNASQSQLKAQREVQERLFAIVTSEKDGKNAQSRMLAALKEAEDALPEAERKAAAQTSALGAQSVRMLESPWFRFFLTFDPRPTLAKVKCPVLALNGELDLQVPPKENLAEISSALKSGGNSQVTVREFPGLNHLFQHCKTGAPSEYAQIEETLAPEVLQTIGDWIIAQTTKK